ncbi:hypothetical protein EJP69_10425 [Variovorax gossypii]|uniref:TniQ domain-containing protein n=1 Tax=Variovorax gossypii TaxID=1679495 RepID=A0A3S0J8V5_9BURK|nr:TniQ family protein [Variovorax gossypii]RTQ34814.1 hypothetical protein EJP69_10425 [Variovorax gossypii]
MSSQETWIESAEFSFPFQDEIRIGESGQGYAMRMALANGLIGLPWVKQALSKTHSAVLDTGDAPFLARWFGASVQLVEFALEGLTRGHREQGFRYAGQLLGRQYFLTRSFPRVCPNCLRELGHCRIAWDIGLTVACVRHRRVLLDRCPSCLRALSWNRPGLDVCSCGFAFEMEDAPARPTSSELFLARMIDQRMDDFEPECSLHSACIADDEAVQALSALLNNLSLDGVMRIVYALATAAMYDSAAGIKRERSSLSKARQTVAIASAFSVKAAHLDSTVLRTRRPTVLVDLLTDVDGSPLASAEDLSFARSMLVWLMTSASRSSWRSKHASFAQRELF